MNLMYQSSNATYQTETNDYSTNKYKSKKGSCNGRCVPCTGECRS